QQLLGRAMAELGSGQPGLEPRFAKVTRVGACAAVSAANTEDRGAETNGECGDRAGSLAALTHWHPLSGPIHARPPASLFEVGVHARHDFTSQEVFRQMSEWT